MEPRPIEEISPPLPVDFEEAYVRPERPIVIRGLARGWPAHHRWTEQYFRSRYGSSPMKILATKSGEVRYTQKGLHFSYVTLNEFFDKMAAGDGSIPYLSTTWDQVPEAIRSDVDLPQICQEASWLRCKFWIGAPGTVAPLHRDSPQNLYAQLVGRKRFYLMPTSDTRRVYPTWESLRILGGVDVEAPDLTKYPRFVEASVSYCDLEPGDVLFIPSWWWHQTRAYDLSMAVNFWWADGALAWKIRAIDYGKRIVGLSQ